MWAHPRVRCARIPGSPSMPIHLPPISRRRFLQGSIAGVAGLASGRLLLGADAGATGRAANPNRLALLSDTHIHADAAKVARNINMADHFRQACGEVVKLDPAPAHLLINGDLA